MPRRKGKSSPPSAGGRDHGSRRNKAPQSKTRAPARSGNDDADDDDDDVWHAESTAPSTLSTRLFLPGDEVPLLILAVVAALSYSPVFSAGFVWDDSIFIDCESVASWDGIYDIWFDPSRLAPEIHYWPLVYTSFWIEHKLWGFNPQGYHVVNLLLHLMNSYLVRRVLKKLGASDEVGWLSAVLFCVHPTRVESVAWVIERKDTLSGLFYLLALLRHPSVGVGVGVGVGFGPAAGRGGAESRDVWISLLFYVLGMLSKSIVVSLPVTILLLPWMLRGTLTFAELRRSVPFFAVGLLMALFDMSMARAGEPVNFGFSLMEKALIASRALCFYLKQMVWPMELAVVYPRWKLDEDWEIWAGCFLFILLSSLASLCVLVLTWPGMNAPADPLDSESNRLAFRISAASFVIFGATLFPVLCVLDYGYMHYSYVADRFGYLAGIVPIALFAVAASDEWRTLSTSNSSPPHKGGTSMKGTSRNLLFMAAAPLLAALAHLTYAHASIYVTEEAYYTHITNLNPNARSMWTNLGNTYMRQGRNEEAVRAYETAFQNDPKADKLHTNYGIVLNKLGRLEEAVKMLKLGLENEENKSSGGRKRNLNELGNAMSQLGRYDEAVGYFGQALAIDPNYAIGWNNMGNDLYRGGKPEEAVTAYRKAFAIKKDYYRAMSNCATVLMTLGRHQEEADLLRALLHFDRDGTIGDAERRLEIALGKI